MKVNWWWETIWIVHYAEQKEGAECCWPGENDDSGSDGEQRLTHCTSPLLSIQLARLTVATMADGKFSDPHISRTPTFTAKILPNIFHGNLQYLLQVSGTLTLIARVLMFHFVVHQCWCPRSLLFVFLWLWSQLWGLWCRWRGTTGSFHWRYYKSKEPSLISLVKFTPFV